MKFFCKNVLAKVLFTVDYDGRLELQKWFVNFSQLPEEAMHLKEPRSDQQRLNIGIDEKERNCPRGEENRRQANLHDNTKQSRAQGR